MNKNDNAMRVAPSFDLTVEDETTFRRDARRSKFIIVSSPISYRIVGQASIVVSHFLGNVH